jgi:hypothetical protein
MGYYKLKCGCVVKILRSNSDNTYQYIVVVSCNEHKASWKIFPNKTGMFHPKNYGAKPITKFEAAILKMQEK